MKKIISILVVFACWTLLATQYSKLSIITAAKAIGKWTAVKAWIASSGFEDEWSAASYLSDDYPQFPAITNAIVQAGIFSAEEIGRVISASRDAAISDAMLSRVVSNDCQTAAGRVKWHGKVVTNIIDTAALTQTQRHEDGWVYVRRFRSAEALPLDRQLSAAERRVRREQERREMEAEKARRKAERISELQTNMVELATSLARDKDYPYELAEMLLQNELNKLIGTNTVNTVITPQH